MKKLLPMVLLLIGSGAGVGAGMFLRPPPASPVVGGKETVSVETTQPEPRRNGSREYVKLNNQFVVPVVDNRQVTALVVLSLSLEVPVGQKDAIYAKEPKLRDSFLQVLFDHANVGGFDGAFTNSNNMDVLRGALREVAEKDMGDQVTDVLIVDIARQDY